MASEGVEGFAEQLAGIGQSTEGAEATSAADSEKKILDQAISRVQEWLSERGISMNSGLQLSFSEGQITSVQSTSPEVNETESLENLPEALNQDAELTRILAQVPEEASRGVLQIPPRQALLTATSLLGNMGNSSGGYPNW